MRPWLGPVLLVLLAGPAAAAAPAFDSGNLTRGQSFEHRFDAPGTYRYHCSLHPAMEGVVMVADADGAGQRVELDIRNFTFEPFRVNVARGAVLNWTNQDAAPHTVTAGTPAAPATHQGGPLDGDASGPRPAPLPAPLALLGLAAAAWALARRR